MKTLIFLSVLLFGFIKLLLYLIDFLFGGNGQNGGIGGKTITDPDLPPPEGPAGRKALENFISPDEVISEDNKKQNNPQQPA